MSKRTKITKKQKADKLWLMRALHTIINRKHEYLQSCLNRDGIKIEALPLSETDKRSRMMRVNITIGDSNV